ncbi:MAG: Rrf2 family transcriptional regulator [Telmatospirillum sp.]|nr:Rrf2 family transcriptional regulator [Telmatospirillum sp.]
MRLLTATDFALRTLMSLAVEPERSLSTEELARDLAVSRNHLQKVVQTLVDGGFVQTTRGARGGVRLARPAAEIRVGAVIRHFEKGQAVVECFRETDQDCTLNDACHLKGMLAGARETFFRHLDAFTLSQCLAESRTDRSPALRQPGETA